LGIGELLERRPRQLSGGQRQRVALGRAIVRRPRAFLFDEPLSNLDAKLRVETRTELSRLHRELQATMIYVTHDQTEAMTMGNQIVVLKDGLVQQIASPLELYNQPVNRFVAGFLGSPPMNFWPARLELDGGPHLRLGAVRAPVRGDVPHQLAALNGKDLVLGLRPENMHLGGESDRLRLFAEVSTTLDVIEPLGSETLLYWSAEESRGVARVEPTQTLEAGGRLDILADLRHAHFFDPSTEATVLSWPGT
jgi:multiple sugar transport system ATP-binding protein